MAEIRWLSSIFLGTVFILSGLLKFSKWRKFHDTLDSLEIFPSWLVGGISGFLPAFEFIIGASVVLGWELSIMGPLLLTLLLCFLLVLAIYRWKGGKELACGCFADFEHKTTTSSLIIRNLLLLASGVPLLSLQDQPEVRPGLEDWTIALAVIIGLLLTWSLLNRLMETVVLLRAESNTKHAQRGI